MKDEEPAGRVVLNHSIKKKNWTVAVKPDYVPPNSEPSIHSPSSLL